MQSPKHPGQLGQHEVPDLERTNPQPLAKTSEAAPYINVQPQTMRFWACAQKGPIQPVRIGNRALRWRWSDLHKLAGVE